MKKIIDFSKEFLFSQDFDALSIGVLDFNNHEYQTLELNKNDSEVVTDVPYIYYDLASLTKPLTNGVSFLAKRPEVTAPMELVLNHRGGLPAWGLLPKKGWQDIILAYEIKESPSLYSDYSALRFMLEFEKKINLDLFSVAQPFWHKEVLFWRDLDFHHFCLQNGFRGGHANLGKVHDPNAFTINDKVSHAGLFATITGVCETLINLDKELNLVSRMNVDLGKNQRQHRFVNGWDTVQDPVQTLAGPGCSELTFGHLGFTGTSIWIDSEKKLGHVLLTNATKLYWYDKTNLNEFRKQLGQRIWQREF